MLTHYNLDLSVLGVDDGTEIRWFSYEFGPSGVLVFTVGDYPEDTAPIRFAAVADAWFAAFVGMLAQCDSWDAAEYATDCCEKYRGDPNVGQM